MSEKKMSELDRRIAQCASGERPDYATREDEWFAWYPVRCGALRMGRIAWLEWVWRDRCMGVTTYQPLSLIRSLRERPTGRHAEWRAVWDDIKSRQTGVTSMPKSAVKLTDHETDLLRELIELYGIGAVLEALTDAIKRPARQGPA